MINRIINKIIKTYRLSKGVIFYLFNVLLFEKLSLPILYYSNIFIENKRNIILGKNIRISEKVYLSPTSLKVGDNCSLGVNLFLVGKVVIGNGVRIGPNVCINGANHIFENTSEPIYKSGVSIKGIYISDDVWIGAGAIINDGVFIGKGSIIGAGSVVVKDIEPYSIYVGNPAKLIRYRNNENSLHSVE